MKVLTVSLKHTKYDIIIKDDIFPILENEIKKVYQNKNIYIITDERVGALYLDKVVTALPGFKCHKLIIEGYEKSKCLDVYKNCIDHLFKEGIVRDELILTLGGGVIGDLGGFIASTIYRGVPYINIPTTLLAQVDSSIGGKTGIDYETRKNVIGTFYQPLKVFIDPQFLKTLSKREFNNGLAELIKTGLIGSTKIIEDLENNKVIDANLIYQSLVVKANIVMKDEFDKKERMLLNFGHSFGHAIELDPKFRGILHGEAVISGMLMALDLGIDLNITDQNLKTRLLNIYKNYKIEYLNLDYHSYLQKMKEDKKNLAGVMHFILLKEVGSPIIFPQKLT